MVASGEILISKYQNWTVYTLGVVEIDTFSLGRNAFKNNDPAFFKNLVIGIPNHNAQARPSGETQPKGLITTYNRTTRNLDRVQVIDGASALEIPCGTSYTEIIPCLCHPSHFPSEACDCPKTGGTGPVISETETLPCVSFDPCDSFGLISGNLNTAAAQSAAGGISGGGGSGHHNVYVIGMGEFPPIPPAVFIPPVEDLNPIETEQSNLLTALGIDESSASGQWVNDNANFLEVLEINNYLNENKKNGQVSQEASEFVEGVKSYLMIHTNASFNDLRYNKNSLNSTSTGDIANNSIGGYDTNTYNTFDPVQDEWPTINNVIPKSEFVGWRTEEVTTPGGVTRTLSCMDFAKEQLAVSGFEISNYFNNDGQTIQIYTELNGVDENTLEDGLSYLKYALNANIPVLVGIDDKTGSPNPQSDNTTDHFVIIVGMGSDDDGNYFVFYDNAAGDSNDGASDNNKLYYDFGTGLISGSSDADWYVNCCTDYDYKISQIRKSKTSN